MKYPLTAAALVAALCVATPAMAQQHPGTDTLDETIRSGRTKPTIALIPPWSPLDPGPCLVQGACLGPTDDADPEWLRLETLLTARWHTSLLITEHFTARSIQLDLLRERFNDIAQPHRGYDARLAETAPMLGALRVQRERQRAQIDEAFNARIDRLLAEEQRYCKDLSRALDAFATQRKDALLVAAALHHRAWLAFRDAQEAYITSFEAIDKAYEDYEEGKITEMPDIEPAFDGAHAAQRAADLLQRFPNYPRADDVKHLLATAHLQTGTWNAAEAALTDLLNNHPSSKLAPRGWLLLAELHFDMGKYDAALAAYNKALALPQGRFKAPLLYKRAWTLYLLERRDPSIEAFLDLLSHTRQNDLVDEAEQYIAILLYDPELTGTLDLEAIRERLPHNSPHTDQILMRYAEAASQYGGTDHDIDVLKQVLALSPMNRHAPRIHDWLVQALRRRAPAEAANLQARTETLYGPDSAWRAQQTAPLSTNGPQGLDDMILHHTLDAAVWHHTKARSETSPSRFQTRRDEANKAAALYARLLKLAPNHPEFEAVLMKQGDALLMAQRHTEAAELMEASLARDTAKPEIKREVAWLSVVALEEALRQAARNGEVPHDTPTQLQTMSMAGAARSAPALWTRLQRARRRYFKLSSNIKHMQNSAADIALQIALGDAFYGRERDAVRRLEALTNAFPDTDAGKAARIILDQRK